MHPPDSEPCQGKLACNFMYTPDFRIEYDKDYFSRGKLSDTKTLNTIIITE